MKQYNIEYTGNIEHLKNAIEKIKVGFKQFNYDRIEFMVHYSYVRELHIISVLCHKKRRKK